MKSMDELREEIRILKQDHIDVDELTRIADTIEQEIDSDYMRLPRDKNDEPIHIGDEMAMFGHGNGQVRRVVKCVSHDLYAGYEIYPANSSSLTLVVADLYYHYKPPTVEDVLENALNEAAMLDRKEGYWPSAADITNIVNKLAPKLQLRDMEQED